MDDRKFTLIIVPHGDLETKTFEIPYRKLRFYIYALIGIAVVNVMIIASWFMVAAQAARVPALEGELKRFERERVKVDSLAQLLTDVESQYERVRQLLGADAPVDGRQPMLPELPTSNPNGSDKGTIDAWPLGSVKGYITRGLTQDANHPGLDIAVPQNSYIRAAGPGTVVEAGEDEVYGHFIRIDHGGGLESLYGHAARLLVSKGVAVKRQQVIALSGSTGRSTAPHLHFEIRQNGAAVDPRRFVKQP